MDYQQISDFATQQTNAFWDTYSFEDFQEQFSTHHRNWKKALLCVMSMEEQYLGLTHWALKALKTIDIDTYLRELELIVSSHQNPSLAVDMFVPLAEDKYSLAVLLEQALKNKNESAVLKLLNKPTDILNETLNNTRGSLILNFYRTVRDDGKHILNDIPFDWFLSLNIHSAQSPTWMKTLRTLIKTNLDQPKVAQCVLKFIQNNSNVPADFFTDMFNGFETVDNISKQAVVEVFQTTLLSNIVHNKAHINSFMNNLLYHFSAEPSPLLKMLFSDFSDSDLTQIFKQYDFSQSTILQDINFLLKIVPTHQHTIFIQQVLSDNTQGLDLLNSALGKMFLQSSLMTDTDNKKSHKRKM